MSPYVIIICVLPVLIACTLNHKQETVHDEKLEIVSIMSKLSNL